MPGVRLHCKEKTLTTPYHPHDTLLEETQKYVSFPSVDPSAPYPHLTGGAVDLTICDADNKPIPMGTEFDHFKSESRTRYYEEQLEAGRDLTPEECTYLTNRRLLFHILTKTGITNYPEEWWHFDYGNQFWASIKGRNAIYGQASNENNSS
jgi:D-alanyl-D-alanine dipeptidase